MLPLPRLGYRVRSFSSVHGRYITHHYPNHEDVPVLLDAMGEVAGELRDLPAVEANAGRFLDLEAELGYLAARAHPAPGGNFSVGMSQVNTIANEWGVEGIAHGHLDYLALMVPFEVWKPVFIARVAAENPDAFVAPPPSELRWAEIPLPLLVRFANTGDVEFDGRAWARDPTGAENAIEGFAIHPAALPEGLGLGYWAWTHDAALRSTRGQTAGQFIATRGRFRAIEGVTMRLFGPASQPYEISYRVKYGRDEYSDLCPEWGFCGSQLNPRPITGLRVWLRAL
jgi:hypothetical protein